MSHWYRVCLWMHLSNFTRQFLQLTEEEGKYERLGVKWKRNQTLCVCLWMWAFERKRGGKSVRERGGRLCAWENLSWWWGEQRWVLSLFKNENKINLVYFFFFLDFITRFRYYRKVRGCVVGIMVRGSAENQRGKFKFRSKSQHYLSHKYTWEPYESIFSP